MTTTFNPASLTSDEKHEITGKMMVRGGEFVSRLGGLWRHGDSNNRRIIEEGWPELFEKYQKVKL